MASLSLCIIFKDEKDFLEDAIRSALPIVDECVLVDSGSQDGSKTIVENLMKTEPKIKYFEKAWPGDFSSQRNLTIEEASKDWILFLDADERISPLDYAKIKTVIENEKILAYEIPILNYTDDFSEIGYTRGGPAIYEKGYITTKLHRLFRRHPQIRYTGILHERIEPSLEALGGATESLEAYIHHLGKLKEKNLALETKRYAFYEDLGRRKVATDSQSAQAHWELGVVLQKQKRFSEAEQEFLLAFQLSPQTEECELYYCMSLYQQSKWGLLKQFRPSFKRSEFFVLIAKAQIDSSQIEALDAFRKEIFQSALLIFELSLKHNRMDRIDLDRAKANELFGATGIVDFIEGGHLRQRKDFKKARLSLEASLSKGYRDAFQELSITLAQLDQFQDVMNLYESLDQKEKASLSDDTRKVIAYSAMKTGKPFKGILNDYRGH